MPTYLPCDSFGVVNSFKNGFADVLAQWFFACETRGANLAFMDVVDLRGAKVPTYIDDALVRDHRLEHMWQVARG